MKRIVKTVQISIFQHNFLYLTFRSFVRIVNCYIFIQGKRFYGPGGPYSGFAGRDASRGLATFSVEPVSEEYDDLSDLKPNELEQVKEWELQFR